MVKYKNIYKDEREVLKEIAYTIKALKKEVINLNSFMPYLKKAGIYPLLKDLVDKLNKLKDSDFENPKKISYLTKKIINILIFGRDNYKLFAEYLRVSDLTKTFGEPGDEAFWHTLSTIRYGFKNLFYDINVYLKFYINKK